MGIFDRIQSEIEAQEKQEGVTPADFLNLSPPLRKLMNHITRQGEVTAASAAERLQESPANVSQMLNALVEKGYLEREKRKGDWFYRTRFARKRGRDIPVGIWSALGQGTETSGEE
jgi:DNA-binding MarR family transcriptional regulator